MEFEKVRRGIRRNFPRRNGCNEFQVDGSAHGVGKRPFPTSVTSDTRKVNGCSIACGP